MTVYGDMSSSVALAAKVTGEDGRVHERNPLGEGHACLVCALPFPCPTAAGGEQLLFEVTS